MASEEEIRLQRENNDLLRQQNELLKQRVGINGDVLDGVRDTSNVLRDQVRYIKNQYYEKTQLRNITNSINKISLEAFQLTEAELATSKGRNEIEKRLETLKKSIIGLSSLDGKILTENKELQANINGIIQDQRLEAQRLTKELNEQLELSNLISDNFGVKTLGGLSEIVKKIPGLSALAGPLEDAQEAAAQYVVGYEQSRIQRFKELRDSGINATDALKTVNREIGKKGAVSSVGALKAGFKSLGPVIRTSLGPLALLAEAVRTVISIDKQTGELAKSLNLSYNESNLLRRELTSAANASGELFATTKGLQESLIAINQTLGTNVMLNQQDLITFTKLREQAGLTNEELIGIQAISLATGQSLEQITGEILAQAKISSARAGAALNEKDILKDIQNISAATTLSFSKNPKLIADAVSTARALGLELSQIESIADSFLDFESSISAELEAQVLTGRQLNLNQARFAALNNDLATVAEEISKQIGNSADFANMNRIQQESIAKSVGMSREDLAKTLFLQEQLVGASGEEAKRREQLFNRRVEEVGLAQAQAELAKEGFEGLENQASMADRLNAVMNKLRDVFVSLVEPLMPVLDAFMSIAKIVGYIMKFISPILKVATAPLSAISDIAQGDFEFTGTRQQINSIGDDFNNRDRVRQQENNTSETNILLKKLIQQNEKKPELSPVGLYQVQ